jgi:hypothetical protein
MVLTLRAEPSLLMKLDPVLTEEDLAAAAAAVEAMAAVAVATAGNKYVTAKKGVWSVRPPAI